MRKIEYQIIDAVKGKKTVKLSDRDYVEYSQLNDLSRVYLHGHKIAVYNHEKNTLAFSFAGYNTNTTKSRINAFLHYFAYGNCNRVQGGLYYNYCTPIDCNSWYTVTDGSVKAI